MYSAQIRSSRTFLQKQIPSSCTLIPEPFTLNRETGAKGGVSKNQGTGYGIRGSVSPPSYSPLPFRDLVILLEGVLILQGCFKL